MDLNSALTWRKSSFSGNNGGNCVEVGITACGHAAGIRDSQRPTAGQLTVTAETFGVFLAGVKRGEYNLGK
jgi:Domain of unknown function (DUF397)